MNRDYLNIASSSRSCKRKMGVTTLSPPLLNLQLCIDQPRALSSQPVQQQQMPPPPPKPVNLELLVDESGSSPRLLCPYYGTSLRLSVTPRPEQGGGGDGGDIYMDLMNRPIKSFTSLLNGDGFNENATPPANLHLHKDFIDEAVKRNNDRVREMMEEMCKRQYAAVVTAAEERATKKMKKKDEELEKLRERNAELEDMITGYRNQAMTMAERMKALEETNLSLNAALHEAKHRRTATPEASNQGGGGGGEATREEEAQSSSLNPDQVVVVRMSCKICWTGPATMMPCSCRHLCLCKSCERTTNRCPVCMVTFQECIEVKFY